MRRAYLLALLGSVLRLPPAGAQSPAPSVRAPAIAAQSEARLKGAIWTTTAERAWHDLKLPQSKKPNPWNTPDDFEEWRNQHASNDVAGLIGLHDKVLKFTGQRPVSPTALKAAILHEIGSLQHAGQRMDAKKLADALNAIAPAATVAKSVAAKPDSATRDKENAPPANDAKATASAATPQPVAKENTATQAAPDSFGNENQTPLPETATTPAKNFSWPWLLLAGTLGAGAGWLAARLARKDRPTDAAEPAHAHAEKRNPTRTTETEGWYKQQNQALTQQKRALEAQVFDLDRTNNALQEELLALRQPPAGQAVAPEQHAPPAAAATTAPGARTKLYASAAPGGFLEHDKFAAQSMGRMALVVEPNGQNPQNARFTLNPDVDKRWLIAADLEKLRDYFTFTLPADRWPSSVEATTPGTLTREGDNWKVEKKAGLTVR